MPGKLSAVSTVAPQVIATATLRIDTAGAGFTDITGHAATFIAQARAGEGTLLAYLRHTSASLTIQENADPDVQADLAAALDRLAPEDAPWIHDVEGPDDMPAHVKAMLTAFRCMCRFAAARWRWAPGRASIWSSTVAARTGARWSSNSSAGKARETPAEVRGRWGPALFADQAAVLAFSGCHMLMCRVSGISHRASTKQTAGTAIG